jgi:hypothetical protein
MDELINLFQKSTVTCAVSNLQNLQHHFQVTKKMISIKTHNFGADIDNLEFSESDIRNHLIQCNYRYLEYHKRGIYCEKPLDYLDRMLILFGQKITVLLNKFSRDPDLELEILFMAYHIDSVTIDYLVKNGLI